MCLCVLAYVALAVLATLPALLHGPSHTLQCGGCSDVGQEVWFLRWPITAFTHGRALLVSDFLNVPYGVNLMQNTSMPLVGVLAAPLVAGFGAVAALNLAFLVAFASSATACFAAALRFTDRLGGAFVAGLLYAFSPFMAGQARAHLFLVAGALPPLMVVCLHELLVRRRRPVVAAALLGLLAAAQFLVSVEVLVVFAVVGLVAVTAVVVSRLLRHRARPGEAGAADATGRLLAELLLAGAVFAAGAGYPAYVFLAGPSRPAAPGHPQAILEHLSTDLAGIVLPNGNERVDLGLASTTKSWVRQAPVARPGSGDLDENGGYLGLPLLALLAWGVMRARRDPTVRLLAAVAAVSLLLSLGSRLHVAGHDTGVPLPFALLVKLPLLHGAVAARFTDAMWLCVALLCARLLGTWRRMPSERRTPLLGPGSTARAAAIGLGLLAAVSLLPALPAGYSSVRVPGWFTSPASRSVPAGTSVLAYPFPRKPHAQEMLWQAVAGIGFRIPGGQAIFGRTRTSATETVFDSCLATGRPAPLTVRRLALMRDDLRAFDVSRIVVPLRTRHSLCAVGAIRVALGRPGRLVAGSEVWSTP